jgi:hypothetical protein
MEGSKLSRTSLVAELKEDCPPIWNLNFVTVSGRSKITEMEAD